MYAYYMFPSAKEIRLIAENQRLRADLRDAVGLLDRFNTCLSKEEMIKLLIEREELKNYPSVKAVMEEKG